LKKIFLSIIGLLTFFNAFSQYNYSMWSAGAGGGFTQSYTDVAKSKFGASFHVNGDYYLTPFLTIGAEAQVGKISGGDKITDPHLRAFDNNYKSFAFNGKVQLGQFVDYEYIPVLEAFKGLYLGAGIGVIQNNVKNVRIKPDGSNYVFPGKDNSTNLVFPFSVGINFGFRDYYDRTKFILSLGYQLNIAIGEGLDGYNDPSAKFKNNASDRFTCTTIGLKYCFGPEGLYYHSYYR
jgi:hypothetical protein